MIYHVSKTGGDHNPGTSAEPFGTISKAALIAQPGDTIKVHAGIYREWVSPANGGTEGNPIVYEPAGDGEVVITGAEIVADWKNVEGTVWKTEIPNSFFGDYNPYDDKIFGDWFFSLDRIFHTGEVYLNGKSMYEAASLEGVTSPVIWEEATYKEDSLYTWYCEVKDGVTSIWANFHGADPAKENVEINVRRYCFWPEKTGRHYITVRGFTMKQAATQWAPPTALQIGLIGPHWSKGWVIENNIISDSKCSGISLGKEISTGENEWSLLKFKQGTQREREVIFRAARGDWNRENVGSHTVRNNTIFNCEQTAIVGHLGAVFSTISNNHIYDIYNKRMFRGAEIAGIKLHAAIDTKISDNFIHGSFRGIWLDWQAQGTHVTRNVLFDNSNEDFFVEVSHGPYLADHNIFLSPTNFRNMSQGGAFVHNLFTGKFAVKSELNRFTPYHFPHETEIAGVMTIMGGDDRFYNNIFIRDNDTDDTPKQKMFFNGGNATDGMPAAMLYMEQPVGLSCYDDFPGKDEKPWEAVAGPMQFGGDQKQLPVFIDGNLYLNNAKPYKGESTMNVYKDRGVEIEIDRKENKIKITVAEPERYQSAASGLISTKTLGKGFQAEMEYLETDGSDIRLDRDFFGNPRSEAGTAPGPFEISTPGSRTFELTYRPDEN